MPRHLPLAALLTAGAGATHLAAAVPHFSTNPLYGTLFVGAGWVQVLLAAVLLASGRAGVVGAAIAVNTAAVISWALSRTVGLPLAHSEPVLLADAVAVALEVAAVGVLVARLRGATFGFRAGKVTALSLVAVLALATVGSTVAIADLASGSHHGEASEEGGSTEEGGHAHADGTVHVHEVGKPHVHADRTVHVHLTGQGRPHDPAGAADPGPEPDPELEDDDHHHEGENVH